MSFRFDERLQPQQPNMASFVQDLLRNPGGASALRTVTFSLPNDELHNTGLVALLSPLIPEETDEPPPEPYGPLQLAALRLWNLQRQYGNSSPAPSLWPPAPPRQLLMERLANVPRKYIIQILTEMFLGLGTNIWFFDYPPAWKDDLERTRIQTLKPSHWHIVEFEHGIVRFVKKNQWVTNVRSR